MRIEEQEYYLKVVLNMYVVVDMSLGPARS